MLRSELAANTKRRFRAACDLQLVHHRHDDRVRLRNVFLPKSSSRRDVLFDRRQELCGGETMIVVEFATEEFRVEAVQGV